MNGEAPLTSFDPSGSNRKNAHPKEHSEEAGGLSMLPPFIIEQIRQREERERERRERDRPQPRLEIPVDRYPSRRPPEAEHEDDEPNRGVVILELV